MKVVWYIQLKKQVVCSYIMWINASRHPMESQNWSPLAYHHSICVVPSPNPTNAKVCAKGFGLVSPSGSSIGCESRLMKRRLQVRIPPSPYPCVDMSKKKKKDLA
jgi:hypothetical protein